MTKLSIETVEITAQDFTAMVAVKDFPQATIDYWFQYGVRRAYQDGINSVAKKLRDAGQPVDGEALFDDRNKIFIDAKMGTRDGIGLTSVEKEAVAQCRGSTKASDIKKYENATPAERDAMCKEYFDALPENQRADLLAHAQKRLDVKARMAAELAALGDVAKL